MATPTNQAQLAAEVQQVIAEYMTAYDAATAPTEKAWLGGVVAGATELYLRRYPEISIDELLDSA